MKPNRKPVGWFGHYSYKWSHTTETHHLYLDGVVIDNYRHTACGMFLKDEFFRPTPELAPENRAFVCRRCARHLKV